MRFLLFAVSIFGLVGCATSSAPKSEIRTVFQMIKHGDIDAAFDRMSQSGSTKYSTYDGGSINIDSVEGSSGRTVKWYARAIGSSVRGCTDPVQKLKVITLVGTNEKTGKRLKGRYLTLKNDFNRSCGNNANPLNVQVIEKVKRLSSVDFSDVVAQSKKGFREEVNRLEIEIADFDQNVANNKKEVSNKKEAYRNSPEFLHKEMCKAKEQIRAAKNAIAKEKAAAQYSGYVDKVKMHRAGRFIQIYGDQLKKDKQEYKKRFGKPWSGRCK